MEGGFHIQDFTGLQPNHSACGMESDPLGAVPAQIPQRFLQFEGEVPIGYRLDQIVQRIHRVARQGILGHIGHEHQQHIRVPLAQQTGCLDTVDARHIHIHDDQVKLAGIPVQESLSIRIIGVGPFQPYLPGKPVQILLQHLRILRVVIHQSNSQTGRLLFRWIAFSIPCTPQRDKQVPLCSVAARFAQNRGGHSPARRRTVPNFYKTQKLH